MGAVQILMLLAVVIAAAGLLVLAGGLLAREWRCISVWKRDEPEICRAIEQQTGERIWHQMRLNASLTDDFSPQTAFFICLFFTENYLVLIHRNGYAAGSDEALLAVERKECSMRSLKRRFAELTLPDADGGAPRQIYLCARPRDFETLARLIRRTTHPGKRPVGKA